MTDRERTLGALTHSYDQIEALTDELTDSQWAAQSLCPDWTMHGVLTHLAGVEDLLTGWLPSAPNDPPPFEKMEAFTREAASVSGSELAARAQEIFAARRADFDHMTDSDFARQGMTPVGPGTYGSFMEIRIFDFWVHERDITIPLGRETDDSGAAAEIALGQVHGSMGYIAGKKIGLRDGMSIKFELRGGIDRDICVAVNGRAGVVDTLPDPDVTVHVDFTTFIMLACGRIDPQEQIDNGKISWTGDDEWGQRAARNLGFTM